MLRIQRAFGTSVRESDGVHPAPEVAFRRRSGAGEIGDNRDETRKMKVRAFNQQVSDRVHENKAPYELN